MRIAVLNGPNLNLLGIREPHRYGRQTLEEIERAVRVRAATHAVDVDWHQTNSEGEFVELIHACAGRVDGGLVNAAAFTHTSLAIRDAFLAVEVPFVEVHLSNVFGREAERRHSRIGDLAIGVVAGFGAMSYLLALDGMMDYLHGRET